MNTYICIEIYIYILKYIYICPTYYMNWLSVQLLQHNRLSEIQAANKPWRVTIFGDENPNIAPINLKKNT